MSLLGIFDRRPRTPVLGMSLSSRKRNFTRGSTGKNGSSASLRMETISTSRPVEAR
jgi:hypothetical protein